MTLNTNIPVLILEDFETRLPGRTGRLSLRKGLRLELPLREAIPLLRKGLAMVDVSKLYDIKELNKIRWIESRDTRALHKLDEYFYFKIALVLNALKEEEKTDERTLELYRTVVLDIIKLRLQKILRSITASQEPDKELMSKLSWEERILYVKMCHTVNEWYRSMLEFLERGDPIGDAGA